jgi:hypothetical protein
MGGDGEVGGNLLGRALRSRRAEPLDSLADIDDVIHFVARNDEWSRLRPLAAAPAREQIGGVDGKRACDAPEDVERGADVPALDLSDVFRGTLRELGQLVLAQTTQQAKAQDRPADTSANRVSGVWHDLRLLVKGRELHHP